MKLSTILSGKFKLDGGAMFGVVPKSMWERVNPPDENNLCSWAMRSLLIETGERKILVDTGIGDKQSDKFRSHFHPSGNSAVESLAERGINPGDITDVFLTHLHFDHVGGALKKIEDGELLPTFPNATYWSNERHYNWAMDPNARERASFLKENFHPLHEQGVLKFIDVEEGIEWLPGIRIHFVYGHTEAMMLLDIEIDEKRFFYMADLTPSAGHLSLPWVMSYDVRPLRSLEEKKRILAEALESNAYLIFEHDRDIECVSLTRNDRGRIKVKEEYRLQDLI